MIKLSLMKKGTLIMASSAIVLSSMLLASGEVFVYSSFAQDNNTTATNETGAMMGNQTNQTGGNQTQQGPLEQLGEALGGVFGGGNQTQ
jgi:peroxiredoxin family protein